MKDYRILAARYRSPLGEIDIVARRGNIIALVEVKARPSRGEALEAIHPRQRARLERAAQDFLAHHPSLIHHNVRFDVMLVTAKCWPHHIPDAWRPNGL